MALAPTFIPSSVYLSGGEETNETQTFSPAQPPRALGLIQVCTATLPSLLTFLQSISFAQETLTWNLGLPGPHESPGTGVAPTV